MISCSTCILQTGLYFTDRAHISGSTKGMGTKLTPMIGLDNRTRLMTSSTLWHHQVYILQIRYRKKFLVSKLHAWWSHNVDDVIDHLLLARPITGASWSITGASWYPVGGISFRSIPLLEPKILNVYILAILVCKIHRKQVAEQMTPFLSINYWELLLV